MTANTRTVFAVVAICCTAQSASSADPFEIAREMERSLSMLQLPGKTGRVAMDTMIGEGYRCGLEAVMRLVPREPGLNAPASIACSKETRQGDNECNTLFVTLFMQWDDEEESLSTLFERLTVSPVEGVQTFCSVPPIGSVAYLTEKRPAETELSDKLAELAIVGESATSAFAALLVEGFQCGLHYPGEQSTDQGRTRAPQIRCTRLPSTTEYCYQEEALLDVTWRDPAESPAQLVGQFGDARIAGMHAVCGLPGLPGNSVAQVVGVERRG